MDIQVVASETPDWKPNFTIVRRTFDGIDAPWLFPREMLAIRAAEYDLHPEDPTALEIMMLENFYNADPREDHPLHSADTVKDALTELQRRLEIVREENGSPTDPKARLLAVAVENERCTRGLITSHALLHEHVTDEVIEPVKFFRDKIRFERKRSMRSRMAPQPTFTQQLLNQMEKEKVLPSS